MKNNNELTNGTDKQLHTPNNLISGYRKNYVVDSIPIKDIDMHLVYLYVYCKKKRRNIYRSIHQIIRQKSMHSQLHLKLYEILTKY